MTDVQKVSVCKFCQGEITWSKDAVTGKNYPKNLNGSPHLCQKNAQKPMIETATQIAQEREEYNKRMTAAGFQTGAQVQQEQKAQPQTQPAGKPENCTSPDTPALKTVEGQIVALDVPAHKITVKTKDGQQHTFVWPQVMHDKMSQLKQWWFTKLTGEPVPDGDLWRLTSQEFFRRPEDWPATLGKGFGQRFQQRNDKAIILQTCMKVAADVLIARGFCEDNDPPFEDQMARITAAAIKAADEICKAGGVQ